MTQARTGSIFPGFRMSFGSNARLTQRIKSIQHILAVFCPMSFILCGPTPWSPVPVPSIAMARCKRLALIRSVTAHCPASSGSSNIEHENGRPTPACSPSIYRKAAWSSSAAALVTHCANLRIGTHTWAVLGRLPGRNCNPTKQASCRAFHNRLRQGGTVHRSQSEGHWAAAVSGKWVQQQRSSLPVAFYTP